MNKKLDLLLKLETAIPETFPRDNGVWSFDPKLKWFRTPCLPEFAVGDIETKRIGKSKRWDVVLGVFLDELGNWYIWNHKECDTYEDCPDILIGHNALEHDSKFLDTYCNPFVIDTMLLMKEMFGVKPEEQAAYKKLKQNHAKGLNVPPWFHLRCESSLKESCKFLLGENLKSSKEIDGLAKYCAKDVYATLRLAQRLIPLAMSQGIEIYHRLNAVTNPGINSHNELYSAPPKTRKIISM